MKGIQKEHMRLLILYEVNCGRYTGRNIKVIITYILRNPDYCKEGYCILGFKQPVKRGEWESSEKLWETQTARCSNCKAEMYVDELCNVSDDSGMLPAFCPRCGCDMRGDEE